MDNKSFDFASFVSVNKRRDVSGFDYLHAVYKAQGLTPEFVVWFAKLFCPDFKNVDGMIFLSETFNRERYQELLSDGHSPAKAQFWMNLLEITGLFDDLTREHATLVAECLVAAWNAKLSREGRPDAGFARAIYDDETGEVFVTIDDSEKGQ